MGGARGFIPYAAVASLEATAMAGPPDMQVGFYRQTTFSAQLASSLHRPEESGLGGMHSMLRRVMCGVDCVQEVTGLRNQYLDTFLPPRRKQGRKAAQKQQQQQEPSNGGEEPGNGAEEPERPRIKLQFLHFPVTDLSIPTTTQCGHR